MPEVMAVAVVSLGLAIAFFLLLAYLLIAGKPTRGVFAVRAGNNRLDSNEGGMLLSIVVLLLLISALTWPKEPGATQPQASTGLSTSPSGPGTSRTTSPPAAQVSSAARTVTPSPGPSSSMRSATSDEAAALGFVKQYLAAMSSSDRSIGDLDNWFVFPVEFYGSKELTDRTKLFNYFTPDPSKPRTTYQQPTPVGFVPGEEHCTLYVTVDYQRANGEHGTTRVKYVLEPSQQGPPFRIRSVTEAAV